MMNIVNCFLAFNSSKLIALVYRLFLATIICFPTFYLCFNMLDGFGYALAAFFISGLYVTYIWVEVALYKLKDEEAKKTSNLVTSFVILVVALTLILL
ncbi:Uncharacterised protein [Salmonella enterica subsp. enterica]|uniref:Uncharacterized protein n=1 Tax=Salmonella enterica I TaxID=59201 RepID=A0A379Y1R5_SALET|nr:Uncharacterised protein [Salmonella enterica subsp. enterica]